MSKDNKKLWGGRFKSATNPLVENFTESISFDFKLAFYDIQGSGAHARMLAHIGLITESEADQIVEGLNSILEDIQSGDFNFDPKLEDIHMNIETALGQKIGAVAGKLHTGRSRNDQVALDERLYLRSTIDNIVEVLTKLQFSLVQLADENHEMVMPGFTHLQYAMPVLVAHHLLAYVEAFERDISRLEDLYARINVLPLGSASMAGSGFPLDREFVATLLDFDEVSHNSMDAVADRDYLIEFLSDISIIGIHLSRISEDLILWASQPYSFVDIDDAFCTGSSLMPNKKNPDVLEIVRGKSGRLTGNLMAMLTIMKGLPMTYNRDLQEDKEPVFDSAETCIDSLEIMAALIPSVTFNQAEVEAAASDDFLYATDWTDFLVKKGIPFREAHEIIGKVVGAANDKKCGISQLTMDDLSKISPALSAEVLEINNAQASVNAKSSAGSTNPGMVLEQINIWKEFLNETLN